MPETFPPTWISSAETSRELLPMSRVELKAAVAVPASIATGPVRTVGLPRVTSPLAVMMSPATEVAPVPVYVCGPLVRIKPSNSIEPRSAPLLVAVTLVALLTPADVPPMAARLMSLPVIVRADSELVAPSAPLTVTSPVPPVSVIGAWRPHCRPPCQSSWIGPPAPVVPPVPPTADRVTLASSVAASLMVMLPALPPAPATLPLPPVVVRLPPSVMPPAVASSSTAPPAPPDCHPRWQSGLTRRSRRLRRCCR